MLKELIASNGQSSGIMSLLQFVESSVVSDKDFNNKKRNWPSALNFYMDRLLVRSSKQSIHSVAVSTC
jgi:hypothetical protein